MFDLPFPIHPTAHERGIPPHVPSGDTDPDHPFALTLSRRAPTDLLDFGVVVAVLREHRLRRLHDQPAIELRLGAFHLGLRHGRAG